MRLTFLIGMVLAALAANAAEAPLVVQTGTHELAAVPFVIANVSAKRIGCDAAIAHWYSQAIGEAAPGERLERALWSDPATGVLYLLNAKDERMPVQTLWCGFAGATVSTRFDIAIERRSGAAEPAIRLTCTGATATGRLDCSRETFD